jgi:NAD(P)-dependent dehydrogenase (short-subunit alcohol dehydrogenase family)
MSELNGKVAVVTGASKGIGAAIAKALSALRFAGRPILALSCHGPYWADFTVATVES